MRVAIVLLVGRWLDLFLMVAPKVFAQASVKGPSIGWIELGIGLGVGGSFALVSAYALGKARIIPKDDLLFEEGVHLVQ